MNVDFSKIRVGYEYSRPLLAQLWDYDGNQGLSRGVITPASTKFVILFVTREKDKSSVQYKDYISGNKLFWEGETQHRSDQRIIATNGNGDEIHLFYRDIHHSNFKYYGRLLLLNYQINKNQPSSFVFSIESMLDLLDEITLHQKEINEVDITEREQIIKSRIGQGVFRSALINLWGSCSITGLHNPIILKASHIKPWRDSTNLERLNPYNGLLLIPNFDLVFDLGLISFNSNGEVMISREFSIKERSVFGVNNGLHLRHIFHDNKYFFEYHRDKVFVG